jgi:hypothetical protein
MPAVSAGQVAGDRHRSGAFSFLNTDVMHNSDQVVYTQEAT